MSGLKWNRVVWLAAGAAAAFAVVLYSWPSGSPGRNAKLVQQPAHGEKSPTSVRAEKGCRLPVPSPSTQVQCIPTSSPPAAPAPLTFSDLKEAYKKESGSPNADMMKMLLLAQRFQRQTQSQREKMWSEEIIANCQFALGHVQEAIETYLNYTDRMVKDRAQETVHRKDGTPTTDLDISLAKYRSDLLWSRGDALFNGGDHDAASQFYSTVLRRAPGNPLADHAAFMIARCFEEKAKLATALDGYWGIAVTGTDGPTVRASYRRASDLLVRMDKHEEAVLMLWDMAQRFPQDAAYATFGMGMSYWARGQAFHAEAIEQFEHVLLFYPTSSHARAASQMIETITKGAHK